jgi:N-acetyl-alpha-D-muramate 1-phosphate uridylyltransferase
MRAMILAAGRGERMGELTKHIPKPLLKIGERHLIEYSLLALAAAGITEIVINVCYHRELIKQTLGDGRRYGISLQYSEEETALETGGGVYQALPWLGEDPFLVMSSDIITAFPFHLLPKQPDKLAHVVLVDNPSYHLKGDFSLQQQAVIPAGVPMLTFGNICVLRPEFFAACQAGYFRLGDVLRSAVASQAVTGEHYQGLWFNIGTPDELLRATATLARAREDSNPRLLV